MTSTIEGHTVEAKGQRLHFLVAGDGPPLVLLHDWPSTPIDALDHAEHGREIHGHRA